MTKGILKERAASPSQGTSAYVMVAGLHAIALLLLALFFYVRALPSTPGAMPTPTDAESTWWGLWPVTYLPTLWFSIGVGVVLATMVWGWRLLLDAPSSATPDQPTSRSTLRRGALGWLYLISALLIVAFFAFPIVHTRWGDAYILSQAIAWPDPALRLTHSWQAPLDVFLHSQLWLALGTERNWQDAMPVYYLLSPLAGALYLWLLLQLAADHDFAPSWLTFGLMASLGLMQLFFGYVENYSFATAGILAFLWLGRRVLQGRSPLWLAALVLGITNATHPSTAILGPALLYIGWIRWQQGTKTGPRIVIEIAFPLLLAVGGTIWLMEAGGHGLQALLTTDRPGGGDASWFVPLWATRTRWEAYTLLSWLHLRDLLNQMLLVAPVVLPSLLWIGLGRIGLGRSSLGLWRKVRYSALINQLETSRFLMVAALAYLLLITIWNPDYGGQRDWDLFSLAWIPTTLWLVSVARAKLDNRTMLAGFAPLLALQALHTAAWIYQNTLPWSWP